MELRARGWSVSASAREVRVSRTCGANWARGYKTYRNGVVVGFVAPLDRLAVRPISSRCLSQDERVEIADLRRAGLSMRAVADRLGRSVDGHEKLPVGGHESAHPRPIRTAHWRTRMCPLAAMNLPRPL
ncbi:helix-turn-helix domain-containing protein [Mycobacterium sp. TJFP1]